MYKSGKRDAAYLETQWSKEKDKSDKDGCDNAPITVSHCHDDGNNVSITVNNVSNNVSATDFCSYSETSIPANQSQISTAHLPSNPPFHISP